MIRRPSTRLILAVLAWGGTPVARAAPVASELEVKAAYIFHFVQFVEWPPGTFADPRAPFVIGVYGDEAMGGALTAMVRGETLGGHPLAVRQLDDEGDTPRCQIVYVSSNAERQWRVGRRGDDEVLTVGESADFMRSGGMIEFFNDHHHVRLRINLAAVRAGSLQISAKLLRVAQVISP
jgi:hypothetical protein